MKKLFSIMLMLTILVLNIGCSEKNNVSENVQPTLLSFKSADINMADDFSEILCTDIRDRDYFIFGKLNSGEYSGYITDTEFAEKKSFIFSPHEDEVIKTAALMKSKKTAVLTTLDKNTFIYTVDSNGNIQNTYNLGEILSPDDYFTEMIYAEDGFYININRESLVYIDANGNFKGNVDTGRRIVCGIVNDSNGSPAVLMSENSKMFLGALNNGNITEEVECGELTDYTNAIGSGEGDYRITAILPNGLYGLKDNSWERLSDFSENDFYTDNICDVEMINVEEFTILFRNEDNRYEIRLLSQRDISEINSKQIIHLANIVGGNIDPYNDIIKKYNSESDKYKVEIVNYNNGSYEDGIESLKFDIISGNSPDIIVFSGYSPQSLGAKNGIFVDLYSLIDSDKDINREDFLDGYLGIMETNGNLYQITASFIMNSLMIKDKFSNGLNSWNFNELEHVYTSRPDNMDFSIDSAVSSKEDMFSLLFKTNRYYNSDTAECNFDSSEFIREMEFIKDNNIGISNNYIGSEMLFDENDGISKFQNDEVLVQFTYLTGFNSLREYSQVYANEPVTFIGFPNDEGVSAGVSAGRTYGITANSQNVEGAWDFLKYYLFSEDAFNISDETHAINKNNFCGIEKFYKKQLEDIATLHTYLDIETGKRMNTDIYYDANGIEFELQPFSKEEIEEYDNFIRTSLKSHHSGDANVNEIVYEEVSAYFADERSAEETAEIIQNRVGIYLSEIN